MKILFWALGVLAVIMLLLWYRSYTENTGDYYSSAPKIEREKVDSVALEAVLLEELPDILPQTGLAEY